MEGKYKIGDRVQWPEGGDIIEMTEYGWLVIQGGIISKTGRVLGHNAFYPSSGWVYLGNYSKSNNFKLIYDILNSTELS